MLFSIIIPVYNVERYLTECVESLCKQTFQDFEAIFVDDGSKDASGEMCDKLSEKYSELSIQVYHQPNSGQIAARQKGMEMAKGDYCLFLDSDDTFTPDALQTVAEAIHKYHSDIVIFNGVRHVGDEYIPFWSHYSEMDLPMEGSQLSRFYEDVISSSRFNNICFKAIKRSVLEKAEKYQNVSYIKTEEDYLMQLPIFDEAQSIVYIPRNIYIYRYNAESITGVKFDFNKYKAGRFIFQAKLKYAQKWNVKNGTVSCNRYLMGRTGSAVKQFFNLPKDMKISEKLAYVQEIGNDKLFRAEYKKFDGVIDSKVAKIVLWLLYHKLWRLALFVAEHDPKVHGNGVNYVGR